MKRLVGLLLCFVIVVGLFGCDAQNDADLLAEIERLKTEIESLKQGNDEAVVEDENTEPSNNDEIVDSGIWRIKYYVDEFKQPTSKGYISNKDLIVGTFSNSATTNSDLYVKFLIDKDDIAISLYEYGSHLVKNSSSRNSVTYDITMKTDDNKKHDIKGTMHTGSDRIFINDNYTNVVLTSLNEKESISFYIVQSDRTTTTYLFTLETSNFADEYQLLE